MKTLYYLKSITHLMNQMNFYQEEIKPKAKIQFRIAGIPESSSTREWKLSILIIKYAYINGYFGSYAQRLLVADHINYNKDVYIDNIEGDFSKYVEKIRKNWVE